MTQHGEFFRKGDKVRLSAFGRERQIPMGKHGRGTVVANSRGTRVGLYHEGGRPTSTHYYHVDFVERDPGTKRAVESPQAVSAVRGSPK